MSDRMESFTQEMKKFFLYSKSAGKPDGTVVEDEALRTPVAVFRTTYFPKRHFAATYNHGPHENILEGSTMNIYDQDGRKFESKVVLKREEAGYLLLESNDKLADNAPFVSQNLLIGDHYLLMGYPESTKKDLTEKQDLLLLESDDKLAGDAPYFAPNLVGGDNSSVMGYPDTIKKDLEVGAPPKPSFLPGMVICENEDKSGYYAGSGWAMPSFSGGPAYKLRYSEFLGLCLANRDIVDTPANYARFVSDLGHPLTEAEYCRLIPGHRMEDSLYWKMKREKSAQTPAKKSRDE